MRKPAILTLIAVVVALATAPSAMACSCAPPDRSTLRHAKAAAVLRLLSVEVVRDTGSSADPTDYRYRVGRVYKGRLRRGQTISVRSARHDATCGLSDDVGGLFGLFLDREDGLWRGNSCWQTTPRRLRRIASAARGANIRPVLLPDCEPQELRGETAWTRSSRRPPRRAKPR